MFGDLGMRNVRVEDTPERDVPLSAGVVTDHLDTGQPGNGPF